MLHREMENTEDS